MKQVIIIRPDGSIHGLQHKRGQGFDLRKMGNATIARETLIEWDEEHQMWFIEWAQDGPGFRKGTRWGHGTLADAGFLAEDMAGAEWWGHCGERRLPAPTIYFADYEDAVTAEVKVIQSMQAAGRYREPFAAVAAA